MAKFIEVTMYNTSPPVVARLNVDNIVHYHSFHTNVGEEVIGTIYTVKETLTTVETAEDIDALISSLE